MDKPLLPAGHRVKKPPDKPWNLSSSDTNLTKNNGSSKGSRFSSTGFDSSSGLNRPGIQMSKSVNHTEYDAPNGPNFSSTAVRNENLIMMTSLDNDMQSDNQLSLFNDDAQSNYISQDENIELLNTSGDEIDFQSVKSKKYKRSSKGDLKIDLSTLHPGDADIRPSCSQNRFALLEDLNVEANVIKNSVKINSVTRNQRKVKQFCPPIFLFGVNIKSLVDQLKTKGLDFKIVNKNNFKSKLYLQNVSAHKEMMQLLREKNIESYSFTPLELRRQALVLRGLYYDSNISDIESDLNKLVPGTVYSVSKFQTSFSRKNNLETGLFLITLREGSRLHDLTGIRFILNQKVSWEKPKNNQKVVQCYRCQKWGHMSKNCNRTFACVKCSSSHEPGKCLFTPNTNSQPFCFNCQDYGHPASWRGCPSFKKYLDLKNKISEKAKEKRSQVSNNVSLTLNSNGIDPNRSFASHFKNEYSKMPSFVNEFLKIAKVLCEPDSLEVRIMNFMKNFESMSKSQAKTECKSLLQEVLSTYGP